MSEKLDYYTKVINDLHGNWEPHEGQLKIGRSLFNDDVRHIFVQCGRKFGKTELCIYMLWRWCLFNPGANCYYISPYLKQSKEIVWANKRIQNFGPRHYVKSINNSELRITFNNDSFIKCDGSDNYEAYRGITPSFVLYDEFKDFRPEFHVAMEPNLAVRNAPLIIIGTPPENEGQYTQMAEEYSMDTRCKFFQMPTWNNPYISKSWLQKEKQVLFARGEEDVWYREYEGKFIVGGVNSIFPMLSRDMVVKHELVIREIRQDMKKLKWYVLADPGTMTCFAVLFACVNPYTKKVYLLDEIYETNQKETTVSKIGRRIINKCDELNARYPWTRQADEAAAWFRNEMYDKYEVYFEPTNKALNKKDAGLSLIKDIMLHNLLVISDRCENLYREMENYVRDKLGKPPKENDHQIDNFRYLLGADFYTLVEAAEPKPESRKSERRGYRISDDFPGFDDWGRKAYDNDEILVAEEE